MSTVTTREVGPFNHSEDTFCKSFKEKLPQNSKDCSGPLAKTKTTFTQNDRLLPLPDKRRTQISVDTGEGSVLDTLLPCKHWNRFKDGYGGRTKSLVRVEEGHKDFSSDERGHKDYLITLQYYPGVKDREPLVISPVSMRVEEWTLWRVHPNTGVSEPMFGTR